LGLVRSSFFEFALDLFAGLFGELGGFEAAVELIDLGALFVVAELLLDGFHLLAEHVLALLFGHFAAGFAGDFGAEFEDLDFVPEVLVEEAEGVDAGVGFEQGLLFVDGEGHHGAEQEDHAEGVFLAGEEFGEVRGGIAVGEGDGAGGEFEDGAFEGLDFGADVFGEREGADAGVEVVVFGAYLDDGDAVDAEDHEFKGAIGGAGVPADDGGGADAIEVVLGGVFHAGIALGDDEDLLAFGRQRCFDGRLGGFAADG